MTHDEIQKEWDSFIEYPDGSSKLYVTTTSALLFARVIANMATSKEREACARLCDMEVDQTLPPDVSQICQSYVESAKDCAAVIRARGNA